MIGASASCLPMLAEARGIKLLVREVGQFLCDSHDMVWRKRLH